MTTIRVIDFETTGTEPPEAEVCEVGVCDLHLEEKRVDPPISWLCSVKSMPPECRAVHHISQEECASENPFSQGAAEGMMTENEPSAIAAHNADFETKFFEPTLPVICTYKAALRVWPEAPAHSNGVLRYWLQDQGLITLDHELTMPTHRAGPDAYVTAHILLALFDAGHTGREMVGWSREPALLPTCPIGKFRGKPWAEVEQGFLDWMLRQEDMEHHLKWNAERELARRQEGDGEAFDPATVSERIKDRLRACLTKQQVEQVWNEEVDTARQVYKADSALGTQINNLREQRANELTDDPAMQAPRADKEDA